MGPDYPGVKDGATEAFTNVDNGEVSRVSQNRTDTLSRPEFFDCEGVVLDYRT